MNGVPHIGPRPVILESPYASPDPEVRRLHVIYLRACLRDSLGRGEAPYASHGLYTQPGVLVGELPEERLNGLAAGFAWHYLAEGFVVYQDLGISPGMRLAVARAGDMGKPCELRTLPALDLARVKTAHLAGEWGW